MNCAQIQTTYTHFLLSYKQYVDNSVKTNN
ncbi:Uncharacterised protein [Lysinibacillus capsici]|jgi:hypothetical protein|uniref:Uncharacterized protein n=1 Tax=Lysinibacillus capsici TaxID=2115968 RepID=A0A2X0XPB7_9BACI|nr:Uncharacterised protein [Lysinibacillus capsici]